MLKDFKPGINKVLVKLNDFNDTLTLSNGIKLSLDYKYRPEVHAQVVGTVAGTPQKLYYNKEDYAGSMEWETTMDLQIGDTVYMEYLAVILALADRYDYAPSYPDPQWIKDGDDMYIVIDYSVIYFAIRNSNIILLNGYCIANPIEVNALPTKFQLIQTSETSQKFAQIKHPGQRINNFLDKKFEDHGCYKQGDIVLFHPYANQKVEHSIHQTLERGEEYVVIQRQWIYATAEKGLKDYILSHKIK